SANKGSWPVLAAGFSSGMRRTTSRPWTWWFLVWAAKAVNGTSATSALDTQVLLVSSKIASVYWIGVHACSVMVAIAFLTCGFNGSVTETWAPARTAAPIAG